jgi:hypothetical protein
MPAPILPLLLLLGGGAVAAAAMSKKAPAKPGAAPTSGTFEFDPNLPPALEAQALGAIKLGTAAELRTFAAQLDGMGYHLTAAALRQRAGEIEALPTGPAPGKVPPAGDIGPAVGPSATPMIVPAPSGPPPPLAVPSVTPPGAGTGPQGLDPGMDPQTAQAVIAALTSETDPAKLQGFAASLQFKFPIAAGLLWAKATALTAQQAPPGPGPSVSPGPSPGAPPASVVVPAAPPPPPTPILPAPAPLPAPAGVLSPVQQTAMAMNMALDAHGYSQQDQALYRNFQAAAGLKADGFPGTGTMTTLQRVLSGMGASLAPVKIYPWRSMPGTSGYDGVNAPTWVEWTGHIPMPVAQAPGPAPVAPAVAPALGPMAPIVPVVAPIPRAPSGAPAFVVTTNQDVQRALNALGFRDPAGAPLTVDGILGPKSQYAVRSFQTSAGIQVDGVAGPQTKSALTSALASHGALAA